MIVRTREQFLPVLRCIESASLVVVDLETTGLKPWNGDLLCGIAIKVIDCDCSVCQGSYYLPFRHGTGDNLPLEYLKELAPALSAPDKTYIGFNYKFDLQFLMVDGVPLPSRIEDVMLAAHLMNENEDSFQLKQLGDKYIGAGSSDEQTILYEKLAAMGFKTKKVAGGKMWMLPADDVAPYAIQDVELTWKLRQFYQPHLATWRLDKIYQEVCEYALITTEMEATGLQLDLDKVREYSEEAKEMLAPATARVQELAGYAINPNSPKQVKALLGTSTSDRELLEALVVKHKDEFEGLFAQALLEYRGWKRVSSTYYEKYLREADPNGVFHANLNLIGTVTGRLSSDCHQIPRYSNVFKVKDVFVARPGYKLLSCDYSQAELRLATHYTQDPNFTSIFERNEDAHQMTADMCRITRQEGKTINFGIIYGLGAGDIRLENIGENPGGLAGQLGVPVKEARGILTKYHTQFPGFKGLYKSCERMAVERGYIRMWTGRVRRYGPKSPPRKAMPNLIQGGTAEIMRHAITNLYRHLKGTGVRMILQVHDQIIFEVPENELTTHVPDILRIMSDFQFRVPMKVDASVGDSWGKLQDWEEYLQSLTV